MKNTTLLAALANKLPNLNGLGVGHSGTNNDPIDAGGGVATGVPDRTAYEVTKIILANFVDKNLRCNVLWSGTVDTPLLQGRISSAPNPYHAENEFIARHPTRPQATTNDQTPTVVRFPSNGPRFVTGQAVLADRGGTI